MAQSNNQYRSRSNDNRNTSPFPSDRSRPDEFPKNKKRHGRYEQSRSYDSFPHAKQSGRDRSPICNVRKSPERSHPRRDTHDYDKHDYEKRSNNLGPANVNLNMESTTENTRNHQDFHSKRVSEDPMVAPFCKERISNINAPLPSMDNIPNYLHIRRPDKHTPAGFNLIRPTAKLLAEMKKGKLGPFTLDTPAQFDITEHQRERREHQIDIGKQTPEYQRYVAEVPIETRTLDHPWTPKPSKACSVRAWQGMMRIWRRKLHFWDVPAEELLQKSEVEIKAEMEGEGALKQDDELSCDSFNLSANMFSYGEEDVQVKEEPSENIYGDVNPDLSSIQRDQGIGDEIQMGSDKIEIKMESEVPVDATESVSFDKKSVESKLEPVSMAAELKGLDNVSPPIDCCCEIICRDNDCRQYAVTLDASLQQRGIYSRITFASVNLVDVDALLTQAECDGRLYVVLLNKEDADRQTLSFAFLTGMKQRCNNIPKSDAVDFLSKDFLSFSMSYKNNSVAEGNNFRSVYEKMPIPNRHSGDSNTTSILTRNEYLNTREFLKRNSRQSSF